MTSYWHMIQKNLAKQIHMQFMHEKTCRFIQNSDMVMYIKYISEIVSDEVEKTEDFDQFRKLEAHFIIKIVENKIFVKAHFIQDDTFFNFKISQLRFCLKELKNKDYIKLMNIQVYPKGKIVISKDFQLTDLMIQHSKKYLASSIKNVITSLQRSIKDFFGILLKPLPQIDEKILQFDIKASDINLSEKQRQIKQIISDRQYVNSRSLTFSTFVINIENFGERMNQFLRPLQYIVPFEGFNNIIELCQITKEIQLCVSANVQESNQNFINSLEVHKLIVRKRVPTSSQIREYLNRQNKIKQKNIQQFIKTCISKLSERIWKQVAGIYQRRDDKYKISHYLELRGGSFNQKSNFLLMQYLPNDAFPSFPSFNVSLEQELYAVSQICSRIIHMASVKITHSDIKPQNLRFNNQFTILKMSDFEGIRTSNENITANYIQFSVKSAQLSNLCNFRKIITDMATLHIKNQELYRLKRLGSSEFQSRINYQIENAINILKEIIDSTTQYVRPPLVKILRNNISEYHKRKRTNLIIKPNQLQQLAEKFYDFYGLPKIIRKYVFRQEAMERMPLAVWNKILSKREYLCIQKLYAFVQKLQRQLQTSGKIMNIQKIPIIMEYLSSIYLK